jgi:murein DD-endopeptidase MepM/ murein hydrolase activator NlpD
MQRTDTGDYPYFHYLEECNNYFGGRVDTWLFSPGMIFGSREKWWPDTGLRPTAHEGLDICYYRNGSGRVMQFDPGVRIPVMTAGTVLAICGDFLGRSVFLQHHAGTLEKLISVYAHIVPSATIIPGYQVAEGEVIGTVADTTGRKNKMPAHLHITIMNIPFGASGEHLNWNFICNSGRVILFNPLEILAHHSCLILPKIDG